MSSDLLTTARQRLVHISTADNVFLALVDGRSSVTGVNDDNAADVWKAVAQRLTGYRHGYEGRHANAGLNDLNDRLQRLLGEVRAHGASPGLLARYRKIREAQRVLSATAAGGADRDVDVSEVHLRIALPPLMRIAGMISNIDQVWPDWRYAMRGQVFNPPPWEHDRPTPLEMTFTPKNLTWLAAGDAKPWVPTLAQAAEAAGIQMQAEEKRLLNSAHSPW